MITANTATITIMAMITRTVIATATDTTMRMVADIAMTPVTAMATDAVTTMGMTTLTRTTIRQRPRRWLTPPRAPVPLAAPRSASSRWIARPRSA